MTGLHRDRLTWLVYLQVSSFGYFVYGFGPTVNLLRDEQDISRALAGLHGTALAVGALLGALAVPSLVRRRGRGTAMWAGLLTLCTGIVVYVVTELLPLTLTGAAIAAVGGSLLVVPVGAVLTDHHGGGGAASISEANALAAGIGAVAPLIVGLAVASGAGWRTALLLLLPAAVALRVVYRGVHYPAPQPVPDHHGGSQRLPGRYWVAWVGVTAGIAIEFAMTLWTADILEHRYDLRPALASAGVTAIVVGMCIGRVFGGRLALRVAHDRLLYLTIGTCAVGFAVFWSTPFAAVAAVGLLLCGLGISLMYPIGLARAILLSDGRPDVASARVGLGASLAAGLGPFVLGALADQVGIHGAFLMVPVLLLIEVTCVRLATPRPTALATIG